MSVEKVYAVVSQNIDIKWIKYYEWAGSDTRVFTGRFVKVEDAIKAIPQRYRTIKVQITDDNGKEINYKIERGVS